MKIKILKTQKKKEQLFYTFCLKRIKISHKISSFLAICKSYYKHITKAKTKKKKSKKKIITIKNFIAVLVKQIYFLKKQRKTTQKKKFFNFNYVYVHRITMKIKVITSDILDWILFGQEKQKKKQ